MAVPTYILYEGKKYIRLGKCNHCGACCPSCPHLRFLENGKTKCAIWDKLSDKDDKEALKVGIHTSACRGFPNSPADLFNDKELAEKCGYYFKEVNG